MGNRKGTRVFASWANFFMLGNSPHLVNVDKHIGVINVYNMWKSCPCWGMWKTYKCDPLRESKQAWIVCGNVDNFDRARESRQICLNVDMWKR